MSPRARAATYTATQVVLWVVVLPGVVLYGEAGSLTPDWRPWPGLVLAAVAAAAGVALLRSGGRSLAGAGVGLFGVAPGPVLVEAGLYRYLRHPMDAGVVVLAAVGPLALELRQAWVVTVAAIVYLVAGYEPLEERRLLEEFGDDYRDYRSRVPRWLPREPA